MMKEGASLIECTLVLALIVFITSLSLRMFVIHDHAYVRAELEKFYACVIYMQRKAYLEKVPSKLTIDIQNQSYYAHDMVHKLAHGVIFGIKPTVKGPPSEPHLLLTQAITFKNNKIFFYADGTISVGTVYFTDNKKSCLYALTCAVAHLSYIRKYIFDNKWLLLSR